MILDEPIVHGYISGLGWYWEFVMIAFYPIYWGEVSLYDPEIPHNTASLPS